MTHDSRVITSTAFKQWCEETRFAGLTFLPFENDAKHSQMVVDREVTFDPVRCKTRFINRCAACGEYKEAMGATPAFLRLEGDLPDGIRWTDLSFGTSPTKSPLLIVNGQTRAAIESRFAWIGFNDAYRTG